MYPTKESLKSKLDSYITQLNEIGRECSQSSKIKDECSHQYERVMILASLISYWIDTQCISKHGNAILGKMNEMLEPDINNLKSTIMNMKAE